MPSDSSALSSGDAGARNHRTRGRPRQQTTGLILCGGRGRRLGGVDKPLEAYRGRPLVAQVAERLTPQVASVLISANRNAPVYARYGRVVPDALPGFAGPLAGISAALAVSATDYLFVCPGDAPNLPQDMVARLFANLGPADAAVAHDGVRRQPLHLLIRSRCAASLHVYLRAGHRSVHGWLGGLRVTEVHFDGIEVFLNLNEPLDFR